MEIGQTSPTSLNNIKNEAFWNSILPVGTYYANRQVLLLCPTQTLKTLCVVATFVFPDGLDGHSGMSREVFNDSFEVQEFFDACIETWTSH